MLDRVSEGDGISELLADALVLKGVSDGVINAEASVDALEIIVDGVSEEVTAVSTDAILDSIATEAESEEGDAEDCVTGNGTFREGSDAADELWTDEGCTAYPETDTKLGLGGTTDFVEYPSDEEIGFAEYPLDGVAIRVDALFDEEEGFMEYPFDEEAGFTEYPLEEEAGFTEYPLDEAAFVETCLDDEVGLVEVRLAEATGFVDGRAGLLRDELMVSHFPYFF